MSAAPTPREIPRRSSRSIAGEVTEAMIPAVIKGITIVCVSERSQIAPTSAAATPTRSQDEKPRSRSHRGEAKAGRPSLTPSLSGLGSKDMVSADTLTFVGHGTVLIEIDGTRLLTDPLLRRRLGPLVRHALPPDPTVTRNLDAVLISHLHHDHADLASLRRIGREVPLLVPPGSRRFFERHGFGRVSELAPGGSVGIGTVDVAAVEAIHPGGRRRFAAASEAIGFLVRARRDVYFAGDTDFFAGMNQLGTNLDLALLPVWGWGPNIGAGHLDPAEAARAAAALSPRIAVPIHWATFYPLGLRRLYPTPLRQPGPDFAAKVRELAPQVEVRVLSPGESTSLA